MNKIILLGRLTKDPEIRYTPSGACVAQFTLAVDRPYTKDGSREADFIPCVTWGKTSETIGNYVHKGQRQPCRIHRAQGADITAASTAEHGKFRPAGAF